MTTASALSKFDILLDKYGSPYFEESEKLEFLNMAQLETLNRLVPDSLGGVVNFEMDANVLRSLAPLIVNIQQSFPTLGAQGETVILKSLLDGYVTDGVFAVIELALVTGFNPFTTIPIKFAKHNNLNAFKNNFFKNPSQSQYYYTIASDGYRVTPNPTATVFFASCIKNPKIMTAGNSPDWDDYVMNQVILHAVKLAGVPLRDEEIQQDVRLSGFQSAQ